MTSEAKIGLLLGLVVIFIIAFVVNGLPGFKKSDQPPAEELMASRQQENPVLGGPQRDVLNRQNLSSTNNQGNDLRTSIPLEAGPGNHMVNNPQGNVPVPGPGNTGNQTIATPPVPTAGPKTYTVQSGDSLASIAIKFYGPKDGNRKVNIDKIFAANKNILRSADEIYEGQKLVIPPLEGSSTSTSGTTAGSTNTGTSGSRTTSEAASSSGTREYVVVEGDSLWKIASSKLGDGSRYDEIAALNNLKNEDSITVGMRLKLPAK